MAIQFPDNIFSNSPKPVEGKYTTLTGTPYLSTDEATGSIDINYRYKGLTVLVSSSIETAEYWWKNGTSNSDLIKKTTGTEGTFLTTASNVNNGNTLTISKSDGSGYQITIDTGSSLQSFNFTAPFINETTVNVNHNLGYKYVLVQVFDNSSNQVIPSEINLVDDTQATITFPEPTSGTAVVSVGGATFNNPTLPAGSNRQLQYNDGGVFGASSKIQFDGTEFALFNADESATALTTGGNTYYSSTEIFHNRTPSEGFIQNFIDNKIQTGEIFSFGNTSAAQYDLVYLSGSTWAPVDQTSNTKATQLLAIYDGSRFITEGYITIGVGGSTSGVPIIDGNTAAEGKPVYIDTGATSAPFLTTDIPLTGIVRILGHLMYKQGDYYLMRFRPDHTWVEIV
jgi:hypothetical protein